MDEYNSILNYYAGTPIIIDYDKVIKTQKRKHKKKRINKKWLKRYGYDTYVRKAVLKDGQIVYADGKIFMNEKTYHTLELTGQVQERRLYADRK